MRTRTCMAPGFRGTATTVQQLAGGSAIPTAVGGCGAAGGGGGNSVGVIDVLARPACMTLGAQRQMLEKQGLRVADELREARQVRLSGMGGGQSNRMGGRGGCSTIFSAVSCHVTSCHVTSSQVRTRDDKDLVISHLREDRAL